MGPKPLDCICAFDPVIKLRHSLEKFGVIEYYNMVKKKQNCALANATLGLQGGGPDETLGCFKAIEA
jgi:hypothetical protein